MSKHGLWIPSHVTLGDHRKTRKLARRLKLSIPTTVGHLTLLWHYALAHAEDGDLSKHDPEDIAVVAGFEGEPADFVDALVAAGFTDRTDAGGLTLHNWPEYGGRLSTMRDASSDAGSFGNHRRWHEERGIVDPSCPHCAGGSGGDREPNRGAIGLDRRGEKRTVEKRTPSSPAPQADGFETFWTSYPKRNSKRVGKAQALTVWKRLSKTDRGLAKIAVEHYRRACDSGMTLAKDAHRWLRDHAFDDWQTPAVEQSKTGSKDEKPPPRQVCGQCGTSDWTSLTGGLCGACRAEVPS